MINAKEREGRQRRTHLIQVQAGGQLQIPTHKPTPTPTHGRAYESGRVEVEDGAFSNAEQAASAAVSSEVAQTIPL